MKFKLTKPVLSKTDELNLRIICAYMGYGLTIDREKERYMIQSDEDIAYVQKAAFGVFIVWRKTEHIQLLHDLLAIVRSLEVSDMLPDNEKGFKNSFINGVRRLLNWVPGVTLNEVCTKLEQKSGL